ncbi:uncharacterized protein [Pempheris klunzingeri]|uniref:uncharacterized protein n=1 Tax=Pempheris klunzingeri TaxID=3127111 RepID=UPI003980FBFB
MFIGRLCVAAAFIAAVVSPLLLECSTTCRKSSQRGYDEGHCPVTLSSVLPQGTLGTYFERVTVRVWMKIEDLIKAPKIEILSPYKEIIRPFMSKRKIIKKSHTERTQRETRVKCDSRRSHSNASLALWELAHCVEAKAESVVSVSYSTTSVSCNVSYKVPDPVPDYDLSVDRSSKSITVTVEPGPKVYTRWCYQKNPQVCLDGERSPKITIDPSQSRSAVLNIPYLLPCVCVQVYYTHEDSRRRNKCPFRNESLADHRDVWRSSAVALYESGFMWGSECPASDLNVSASLCWRQHEHLCIPVLNSTLEEEEDGQNLMYSTSAVDKHPQMCVKFSIQGSHNISCPFQADMSSWEVHIGLGRQSVFLYLTSFVAATFSAQLCVLNERGCTPIGQVHSVTMEGNTEATLSVPLHSLDEKLCVQVWQSDPSLRGSRILCPDYTHYRCGMYAVAALIFVVVGALLGILMHRLTKVGAAGCLYIQRPVLLVCSSERSAHVSPVCALASVLQGELSATVHMTLWAQGSQTEVEAGNGVADLGPLPWLYGQWEAMREAQGKVLIIWSPEATRMYEKWREERANFDKNEEKKKDCKKPEVGREKIRGELEEHLKLHGKRLGKCKKERAGGKKDCAKLCDDRDWYREREPSTVIAPVFTAALACLEAAMQGCKGPGLAFVHFQGLCHSRDIPKAFRGIPRYCLPQDFGGLIQELGGMRRQTKSDKFRWHCWPRLLSKVLSMWMARQLAKRLQTLLSHTQGQSVASSLHMMSDKAQSGLKLPWAANMARPGTAQEHEPLHESPW